MHIPNDVFVLTKGTFLCLQIFYILDTLPNRDNRRAPVHVPFFRRGRQETTSYYFYA